MSPLDTVLPFLTLFVGGLIAYWVNVRTQRRAKIDEVFHEAIAAVAISESRRNFITGAGPWTGASDDEVAAFGGRLEREGQERFASSVADATAAIARASVYNEGLRHYSKLEHNELHEQADAIMARLSERFRRRENPAASAAQRLMSRST